VDLHACSWHMVFFGLNQQLICFSSLALWFDIILNRTMQPYSPFFNYIVDGIWFESRSTTI
jgi:hypothetical protein